jgi:aldehyde dehydrogenase (NAD+)
MDTRELLERQRAFFQTDATKDVAFRVAQLRTLKNLLKDNEEVLYEAICGDFGKSPFETYMTELALIHGEINLAIRKLPSWAGKRRVRTNLANFPGRSTICPEPLGNTLVISAWNFPYQLSLIPVVSAMAAGNTVILKPSEIAPGASRIMARLINRSMDPSLLHVVEGGIQETTRLLKERFDKIFFTGSTSVGRIVYEAAARHLTPVTLELAGKNPVIVLPDCDVRMAAQRIAWGKCLNSGQSCVAPDHLWVHRAIEGKLLLELKKRMHGLYAVKNGTSHHPVKIIHDRHFNRLVSLLDQDKIYCGGHADPCQRTIEPTILRGVTIDHRVMQDEIFGPILPVVAFDDIDEPIAFIKSRPRPLALYIFSSCRRSIDKVHKAVSFGGGAVNDTVLHFTNPHLPFGGVGFSGLGSYHGEAGFRAFSHYKSILEKPCWFEPFLKYPPYTRFKQRLLQLLLE